MASSEKDLDELKALQREVAALRSERLKKDSTAARPAGQEQEVDVSGDTTNREEGIAKPERPAKRTTRRRKGSTGTVSSKQTSAEESLSEAEPATDSEPLEEVIAESAKTLENLNIDFNAFLNDMEHAVRERPVLTLLAAFSVGVVVGQLFSRK
ncbi:MAG: hypothetical protein PVG47_05770 [Chromatiales bacterium]|jgi:ElaB/YqjD/DUF883 family membrane-anchored ribosome-binding protein